MTLPFEPEVVTDPNNANESSRATSAGSIEKPSNKDQTPTAEQERQKKLIKFVCLGAVASMLVIGFHVSERLSHTPSKADALKLVSDDILELTQRLYEEELIYNKVIRSKFVLNLQNRTTKNDTIDRAPLPLIQLNDDFYTSQQNTTIAYLKNLFDNYALDVHLTEKITAEREREEFEFLHAVLRTKVMQETMQFLAKKGKVALDKDSHFQLLKEIWFKQYARNKAGIGSSGFEHVFLAELKGRKVLGLHNWLYFAEQEGKRHADYRGYYKEIKLKGENLHLVEFRMSFLGRNKPINSFLIGSSPELDLSLYTVCFLLTVNRPCPVQLGNAKFDILTFSWREKGTGTRLIGSAFTALESKPKKNKKHSR